MDKETFDYYSQDNSVDYECPFCRNKKVPLGVPLEEAIHISPTSLRLLPPKLLCLHKVKTVVKAIEPVTAPRSHPSRDSAEERYSGIIDPSIDNLSHQMAGKGSATV